MKKMLIVTLGVLLAAGGSYALLFPQGVFKLKRVSESGSIPAFINQYMARERMRVDQALTRAERPKDSRLAALGFPRKTPATLTKEKAAVVAGLFQALDSLYPNNLFISYGCLDSLLKTYGLTIGGASDFKAEVPDDALARIEAFPRSFLLSFGDGERVGDWVGGERLMVWGGPTADGYGALRIYQSAVRIVSQGLGRLGKEKNFIRYARQDLESRVGPGPFYVVAPLNLFTKSDQNAYAGARGQDPMVLYPVDGGYIIVCSW